MTDIKKPLATVDLALAAVSLLKTAALVFVIMALEWSRLKERKAQLHAAGAENDVQVEKIKTAAAEDHRPAVQVIDDLLHAHGLPSGKPSDSGT